MKTRYEYVSQLMSTPVVSIEPRAYVGDVLELSQRLEIHHFPIVDEEGLFGVVCTCDLQGARPEQAVSQFAHRRVVTVTPKSTVEEAARRMATHGVGSVVVADDEGVWGILTRDDLAETAPDLVGRLRCVKCSTQQHLRRGSTGALTCPACETRATEAANAISSE